MEAVPKLVQHFRSEMSKVVVGQEELKTQCLIALLCQGHALLEGVPGIAKTLAVNSLSSSTARFSARAMHFGSDARRHRRHQCAQPGGQHFSAPSRTGFHSPAA